MVMGGIGKSKFAFAENCDVDTNDFQIIFFLINITISYSTLWYLVSKLLKSNIRCRHK